MLLDVYLFVSIHEALRQSLRECFVNYVAEDSVFA